MGNNQLPTERTSEKHILRGSQVPLLHKQKKLFCEDKDIGKLIYMVRKGAMVGGSKQKVRAAGARKPRAVGEEGMQEGAYCLAKMNEGGGGLSSLESDTARVPGSTWPSHQGMM